MKYTACVSVERTVFVGELSEIENSMVVLHRLDVTVGGRVDKYLGSLLPSLYIIRVYNRPVDRRMSLDHLGAVFSN